MNRSDSGAMEAAPPSATQDSVERLTDRLEQLAAQFESALELSRDLQSKQVAAQEQITTLQAKVDELEAMKETMSKHASEPVASEATPSAITNLIDLTKNLEGRWERQQEAWETERDRLRAAKEEWERRVRRVEDDLVGVREIASTANSVAANASSSASMTAKALASLSAEIRDIDDIDAAEDHEFAAPPSPRSISSDVLRNVKRKRSSARAQSRSSSQSPPPAIPNGHIIGNDDIGHPYSPTSLNSAPYANGQVLDSNGYGNDPRRLPSGMKGLDSVSRTDSMSSSSISSTSGRKPDIVSATFLPRTLSTASTTTLSGVGTTGNSETLSGQHATEDEQLPAEVQNPSVKSSPFISIHSHYGRRIHWLILIFIFSFLLPQPIPYMSAAATLGVALIGVAAWTAANHIHA
jgi:chromosome segregation ATPase